MAERITDQQVTDLIAILRTDASIDAKVQQVTAVKSGIKQQIVPEDCILPLFEALRTASSSQHAVLTNAGFTALNHLFTRLARQEPKYLAKEGARTLPLIVEKLGDQKEKFRQLALQALGTLYKVAPVEVERAVRNTAMVGKNPRAKEASLTWLLQMHQENGLQFRAYVPTLMELLEDADPGVREVAKSTVIELFQNAPNAAKSDLKRQLKNFKVRPAIEQAIVKALNPTSSASISQSDGLDDAPPPSRPTLAASVSAPADRPVTPGLPDSRAETVEPTYVNTTRELDDILREMHFHFEGRETEQNWMKREESITRLRRLMAGNAATDFSEQFLTGLRGLLDGIIKAITSLRTSLSKEGCSLVQDIARVYGPAMDPMVELLMQTFIKLTAATKKIASALANTAVDTIISRVTYNARIMQHIWLACQDKNVQPRLYASGWLKTLLNKEAHHKNHLEHTGGLDMIEKSIKKGLADANPGVREKMRATYWTFAGIWPARAEAIMSGLDATAARLLQNDPNNPNSPKKPEGGARPGLGLSKSTMGTSKPSLRETMMAQKRAITTTSKALPARPGSAMSHFSPVRTVSGGSQAPEAPKTSTVRTRPESAILSSTGGISGAPVRPGRRRPEMAPRPATAGPYSVRSHDQPSTEKTSPPRETRTKAVTPKSITASPKRTVPKVVRPHQAATSGEPHLPTPTKPGTPKGFASPRTTPLRSLPPVAAPPSSSASKPHEDLTLVVPTVTAVDIPPSQDDQQLASPVDDHAPTPSPSSTPSRAPILPDVASFGASQTLGPAPDLGSLVATPTRTTEVVTPASAGSTGSLKVYEDPFTGEQTTPKPAIFTGPVLEDRPVNEDAALLQQAARQQDGSEATTLGPSPEKIKQNQRLLDSGIAKVQQKTLDVHGFRKLQSIIREHSDPTTTNTNKSPVLLTDEKFDALTTALFAFLESPLPNLSSADKAQDVKAQALATVKLLLKRMRASFQPHVSRALEALLRARARYESRTHIVAGLELLAGELAGLGDASEIVVVLTRMLGGVLEGGENTVEGEQGGEGVGGGGAGGVGPGASRSLSMGLHVLREMIEARSGSGASPLASSSPSPSPSLLSPSPVPSQSSSSIFIPSDSELDALAGLAARCLESAESAVRMDAVLLCVALHARVGDARFWEAVKGVAEDPKSLITYYIVRRQREAGVGGGGTGGAVPGTVV